MAVKSPQQRFFIAIGFFVFSVCLFICGLFNESVNSSEFMVSNHRMITPNELERKRSWNLRSTIFWDITPCSPLSVNRRLGRTSPLLATCVHAGFLLSLFFRPWRWRQYVPPKLLTLNGLHGVISQKMVLFITTAVKTSDPTRCWNLSEDTEEYQENRQNMSVPGPRSKCETLGARTKSAKLVFLLPVPRLGAVETPRANTNNIRPAMSVL
jgi:hypothetical protein